MAEEDGSHHLRPQSGSILGRMETRIAWVRYAVRQPVPKGSPIPFPEAEKPQAATLLLVSR